MFWHQSHTKWKLYLHSFHSPVYDPSTDAHGIDADSVVATQVEAVKNAKEFQVMEKVMMLMDKYITSSISWNSLASSTVSNEVQLHY